MKGLDPLWLVLAGFGAGLSGSVAGLASLVSYPALLAIGLPPVSANVSNTVALVFSSVGSVWGSRPELTGQRARARRLGPIAVTGGLSGGLLLLETPSSAFALVVPWLIGLASLTIVIPRNPARREPNAAVPADLEAQRGRVPCCRLRWLLRGGGRGAAACDAAVCLRRSRWHEPTR